MITFENAQAYFSGANHSKAAVWAQFDETSRQGAIATARRSLSRMLGRALKDDEAAYQEGDRTRDEFAVYEQALYILENGVVANGAGSDPVPILTGNTEEKGQDWRKDPMKAVAPEALRWLGWGGVEIIRG